MASTFTRCASRLSPLYSSRGPALVARTPATTSLRTSRALRPQYASYSTASEERGDTPGKPSQLPPWLIYMMLPAIGVFGTLTFLKRDEGSIRKNLLDENKVIGRAHDCHEVHEQDIDKWTATHPGGKKHSEHWHALKKEFKEYANESRSA